MELSGHICKMTEHLAEFSCTCMVTIYIPEGELIKQNSWKQEEGMRPSRSQSDSQIPTFPEFHPPALVFRHSKILCPKLIIYDFISVWCNSKCLSIIPNMGMYAISTSTQSLSTNMLLVISHSE